MSKLQLLRLYAGNIGVLIVLIFAGLCSSAYGLLPEEINYQGVLTDNNGAFLQGNQTLTLRLYDVASGGTALVTETHTVAVTDGYVNVNIGSIASLSGLSFDRPYWVGIQVNGDAEMTPRQKLTSSAYSFRAKDADTVGGLTPAQLSTGKWQGGPDIYYADGNVGIGISTPTHQLMVENHQDANTSLMINNSHAGPLASSRFVLSNNGSLAGGSLVTGGQGYTGVPNWQDAFALNAGASLSGGLKIRAKTGGIGFSVDGGTGDNHVFTSTGNVGIGLTSPIALLHVEGDKAGIVNGAVLSNRNTAANALVQFVFLGTGSDVVSNGMANIRGGKEQLWTSDAATRDGYLSFLVRTNNSMSEKMRVTSSSNVGIGTTVPTQRLHVNGVIRLQPTDAPGACNSGQEGSMYFDDSLNEPCYCSGSAWQQFDGGGSC